MTTRSMMAAFAVTFLLAWGQLGGVAEAQREPVQVERPTSSQTEAYEASDAGPVHAHVQLDPHGPRLNGSRILGWFLIPVGAVGVGGGLVLALIGSFVQHPICWSECSGHDATAWFAGSGISVALGALSLIAGITLVASNPTWDEANVPNVRVALAPTEGGAMGTVVVDF